MSDKTVKELADAYGISKQAINYHIKKLSKDCIKVDSKGMKLISEKGQQELKKMLSKEVPKDSIKLDSKDLYIKALEEDKKYLQQKLDDVMQMLDQSQKLQALAESKLQLLEDKQAEAPKKKKWFWEK